MKDQFSCHITFSPAFKKLYRRGEDLISGSVKAFMDVEVKPMFMRKYPVRGVEPTHDVAAIEGGKYLKIDIGLPPSDKLADQTQLLLPRLIDYLLSSYPALENRLVVEIGPFIDKTAT